MTPGTYCPTPLYCEIAGCNQHGGCSTKPAPAAPAVEPEALSSVENTIVALDNGLRRLFHRKEKPAVPEFEMTPPPLPPLAQPVVAQPSPEPMIVAQPAPVQAVPVPAPAPVAAKPRAMPKPAQLVPVINGFIMVVNSIPVAIAHDPETLAEIAKAWAEGLYNG